MVVEDKNGAQTKPCALITMSTRPFPKPRDMLVVSVFEEAPTYKHYKHQSARQDPYDIALEQDP